MRLKDLIPESILKEDDIVKNKKTGNVYVVKQMDPAKHDKPTPAEVDKTKATNGGQLPKGETPSKPTPQQPQQQKPQGQKLSAGDFKSSAEKGNNDDSVMSKIKDFVGSKGFQFGARRPSEEEDKVAANHFSDYENKKVNSIGVDKVTGNIYAANDDYEVVLSPNGKVLKRDTSITGKYNKDALDAYQGELEKDADKYYKRQAIKNKIKSLLGYKPDEFGDYRW
jgi:hypothetical protein